MSATTPIDTIETFLKQYVEKHGEKEARAVEALFKTHTMGRVVNSMLELMSGHEHLKQTTRNAMHGYSAYMIAQYFNVMDLSEEAAERAVEQTDQLLKLLDTDFGSQPKILMPN